MSGRRRRRAGEARYALIFFVPSLPPSLLASALYNASLAGGEQPDYLVGRNKELLGECSYVDPEGRSCVEYIQWINRNEEEGEEKPKKINCTHEELLFDESVVTSR